jgi:FkbM family methyltransferase
VEGFRFWFDTSDREMGVEMALGTYEPHTVAILKRLLKPGMRCLDIGAHAGFYTCLMASCVGATGWVDAIEPMPSSYSLLEKNIHDNDFGDIVQAHQWAASNRTGIATASVISNMYVLGEIENMETAAVDVRRIDDVVSGPIDLVKIDIEGHELAAIEGMREIIARDMPIIISSANEYWLRMCSDSSISEYVRLLSDLGYEICDVEDVGRPLSVDSLHVDELAVMNNIASPLIRGDHAFASQPQRIGEDARNARNTESNGTADWVNI